MIRLFARARTVRHCIKVSTLLKDPRREIYSKIRTIGIKFELEVTMRTLAFTGGTPKGLSCPVDQGQYI